MPNENCGWTPGPWKVDQYDQPVTVCGQDIPCFEIESVRDCCWIAKVQDHRNCVDTKPGPANAHLIAAAPDLYAALKAIADACPSNAWIQKLALAALAKARGEKP